MIYCSEVKVLLVNKVGVKMQPYASLCNMQPSTDIEVQWCWCCRRGCRRWWFRSYERSAEYGWNRASLAQTNLSRASFYWYTRETQRGTFSSDSRSQAAPFQRYSASLSSWGQGTSMYVCMYVCMCVYIYILIYIYIYIYIYIQQ